MSYMFLCMKENKNWPIDPYQKISSISLAQNIVKITVVFQNLLLYFYLTSHLGYTANQMTGFDMKYNIGLKWLKAVKKCMA